MRLDLHPPESGAGIAIGSTRDVALEQCRALGEPEDFRRGSEGPPGFVVHRPSGLSVFVYFDADDLVEMVELRRPTTDDDVVTYGDLDVFATPAEELIDRLRETEDLEVTEEGRTVTAPRIHLTLWRPTLPEGPDDEEGHWFEAVACAVTP